MGRTVTTMDNGSQYSMTLQRMEFGGFVVLTGRGREDYGTAAGPVYAATSIDDALKFMRAAVNPVGGAAPATVSD